MTLEPDQNERAARVMGDLRIGLPVVLRASAGDAALVAPAETVGADRMAAMREIGPAHVAVTARRAEVLRAMVYDGDLARLAVPRDADLRWLRALADPSADLAAPLKGPFRAIRGGDAALDRAAIGFCKAARLLPAALVVPMPPDAAVPAGLSAFDIGAGLSLTGGVPIRLAGADVPLRLAGAAKVHVFGERTGLDEHYAVEIGTPSRSAPVLARLHSACFTGDVLGSLKCDCGAQLSGALAQMAEAGAGVLVYLNQEGRGIGLANKLRAYALQAEGFDTVEANHRLGFEDDERDFRVGAEILKALGFTSVRLMTNNPAKVARMAEAGLPVVERVAHRVGATADNAGYLATKAEKSGHLL